MLESACATWAWIICRSPGTYSADRRAAQQHGRGELESKNSNCQKLKQEVG